MAQEWNAIHIPNDAIGNVLGIMNVFAFHTPNDFVVTKNVGPDKHETNIHVVVKVRVGVLEPDPDPDPLVGFTVSINHSSSGHSR